jgi:hypothetical protein
MAYLRSENEKLEMDYPLEKVWAAIPEIVKALKWDIEEKNDQNHHAKIKTKPGFLAYSSIINVDVSSVDENTTKMAILAETPVTTITSVADFGRTGDRIALLVEALALYLEGKPAKHK